MNDIKVFISWSGDRSGKLAKDLAHWLPRVINSLKPWFSSEDIDPGTRWNQQMEEELGQTHCGILCLTPENLSSPWILYEAGALSRAIPKARVIPYLVNLTPEQVHGPLAQFHAAIANESGSLKLLNSINRLFGDPVLDPIVLKEQFELRWPKLNGTIQEVLNMDASEPMSPILGRRAPPHAMPPQAPVAPPGERTLIGLRIQELRKLNSFTRDDLAASANIPPKVMERIEGGEFRANDETLSSIARALDVGLNDLREQVPKQAVIRSRRP